MPLKTESIVAIIVIALVLCYAFGTLSAHGGVTGSLEFTF